MKQSKGLRISALLFVALLAVAAFSGAASANQEDLPEHAIIGPNNLDEGIPDFGPEVFEEIKQDQNVIGTYGKIPLFETAKQREDWLNTLDEAAKNVRSDVSSPNQRVKRMRASIYLNIVLWPALIPNDCLSSDW